MPHENRRSPNNHREADRLSGATAVEQSVRLRENIAFQNSRAAQTTAIAPFSVMSLWTSCTRLKTKVIKSRDFY
jgi:hypothetical protein